jgi:hypothetical protein
MVARLEEGNHFAGRIVVVYCIQATSSIIPRNGILDVHYLFLKPKKFTSKVSPSLTANLSRSVQAGRSSMTNLSTICRVPYRAAVASLQRRLRLWTRL